MANQPQSNPQVNPQQSGREREGNLSRDRERLGENIEHITEDIRQRASRMAQDVGERAKDVYQDANAWLQENYGRTLVVVGVLAAAGLLGYFLARNNRMVSYRSFEREPDFDRDRNRERRLEREYGRI